VSVRGRFRANNSEAVRRAALNGQGIALLSHLLVADDISAGRLRVLMPAFPPARFPLTVVYPSRRNLPPRVRAVIEFLSEIIQPIPRRGMTATHGPRRIPKCPVRTDQGSPRQAPRRSLLIPIVTSTMSTTEIPAFPYPA